MGASSTAAALHEGGNGGFVVVGGEALEQLGLGQFSGACGRQLAEVLDNAAERSLGDGSLVSGKRVLLL